MADDKKTNPSKGGLYRDGKRVEWTETQPPKTKPKTVEPKKTGDN